MTRKLFSVMLSALALLLLMGAAAVPEQSAALLAEEESAVSQDAALETEADAVIDETLQGEEPADDAGAEDTAQPEENDQAGDQGEEDGQPEEVPEPEPEPVDDKLLIDGVPAPLNLGKFQKDGVTYVSLAAMAQQLDSSVQVAWDGSAATLATGTLQLTAQVGQLYMVANDRYLYLPEGVQIVEDRVTVPLSAVAKAFGAQVSWDAATATVLVTRGTETIQPGESYYDQESLFWLSRIIYAESGNQPLEGKMAVGNVVLNRVANPAYPDTVQSVLAQKNQFSPYRSGALAERTPNASSILAAKLVLDGGVVEETRGALYFDSTNYSWASKHKEFVATLGGHNFYR